MVKCPICGKLVKEVNINRHIDSGCDLYVDLPGDSNDTGQTSSSQHSSNVSSFFSASSQRRVPVAAKSGSVGLLSTSKSDIGAIVHQNGTPSLKRSHDSSIVAESGPNGSFGTSDDSTPAKKVKAFTAFQKAAPLAERMRPQTLNEVCGQELVGPNGILRGLIEQDRVPSMILWGGAGTGKTTIARVIANMVGSRFVEINSTSSGVGECKKLFAEVSLYSSWLSKVLRLYLGKIRAWIDRSKDNHIL
jgi:putative ATPase